MPVGYPSKSLVNPASFLRVGGGAAALLLDAITPQPAYYFAERKVRSAYAGSANRLRRSNDDAESDIGFSANVYDSSAATTHTGANNGFLAKRYDQSANGRDYLNATTSFQPQLVSSGSVITTVNSKPSTTFDGIDNRLTNTATVSTLGIASAYTFFCVFRMASVTATGTAGWTGESVVSDTGGYLYPCHFTKISGVEKVAGGHFGSADHVPTRHTISVNTNYVFTCRYTGSNVETYLNGGTANSTSAGNIAVTTGTTIHGANYALGEFVDGCLPEFGIWASSLSVADMNTLGNDIASFYGITWTNIS